MVQAIRKHENKKQNINTYFAFSVRPVLTNSSLLIFSTQPLTNYFTLQRYIALVFSDFLKIFGLTNLQVFSVRVSCLGERYTI